MTTRGPTSEHLDELLGDLGAIASEDGSLVFSLQLLISEILRRSSYPESEIDESHAKALARLGQMVSTSLWDVRTRWSLLHWCGDAQTDERRFDEFAKLLVRDTYIGFMSLMDSLAWLLLNFSERREAERIPGFSALCGEPKGWRKELSRGERKLIDSANEWFEVIKEVRDILVHRPHTLQVVRYPDGIAFLFYEQARPVITTEMFNTNCNSEFVDLDLHLSWLLAEFLVLTVGVVEEEAPYFGISLDQLPTGCTLTFPQPLLATLQSLRRRACT